jgi:hypothetical protein
MKKGKEKTKTELMSSKALQRDDTEGSGIETSNNIFFSCCIDKKKRWIYSKSARRLLLLKD